MSSTPPADLLSFSGGAVPHDRVANVLLAHKAKGQAGNISRAAEDIARSEARALLWPLLDTACTRLGYVLRRAFDNATEHAQLQRGQLHQGVSPTVPGRRFGVEQCHNTGLSW